MKIRHFILVILALPLIFSCQERKKPMYENFQEIIEKLPGLWKIDNADYFEEWGKSEDIYLGRSFSVEGNDTIIQETIRIYNDAGKIIYEPTVFNQNDGNPVKFELIMADSNILTFENKLHDFPQQISYLFLSKNQMIAKISGIDDGKEESISFNFTKQ